MANLTLVRRFKSQNGADKYAHKLAEDGHTAEIVKLHSPTADGNKYQYRVGAWAEKPAKAIVPGITMSNGSHKLFVHTKGQKFGNKYEVVLMSTDFKKVNDFLSKNDSCGVIDNIEVGNETLIVVARNEPS